MFYNDLAYLHDAIFSMITYLWLQWFVYAFIFVWSQAKSSDVLF